MKRMTRRDFLQQAGAGVVSASMLASGGSVLGSTQDQDAGEANGKRPNILFIMTDQQSATMMSCTGNKWVNTPAMDSLMERGMRFEKTYATNPVCVPSRFSLMTGCYPSAIGMRSNGEVEGTERFVPLAMGHTLRAAGYKTVYGGKVHLPGHLDDIEACGFDSLGKNARDELADNCAAFLKQPHDQPFLLVASFINPHDICYQAIMAHDPESPFGKNKWAVNVMREAEAMPPGVTEEQFYETICPPLRDNHEITQGEPPALTRCVRGRKFRGWIRDNWGEKEWRLHRWAYCQLTERVDRQIGIVLDALSEAGLGDDTVVVFTSDHGDMDGAHRIEHKSMTYEEAARVPLMIRWPGLTKPGHVDNQHLISNGLDILPTLCDFAGAKPPDGLKGRSLKPLLGGDKLASWREDLMIETQFAHGVTDGRYKYTLFDRFGSDEMLCDLQTDPGEMKNLAGQEQHADTLGRMRKILVAQAAAHNAKLKHDVPTQ